MGWACHISRKNNMVRKSSLRIFIKRAKWALFDAHSLFGANEFYMKNIKHDFSEKSEEKVSKG